MAEAVLLPKIGMTMEEGTLCRWLLAEGATVSRGQPIFEMETEKVQMEVEAEHDGVLCPLVAEGTTLKPGDVVGCLLAQGEDVPRELRDRVAAQTADIAAGSKSAAPPAEATPQPAPAGGPPRVTPIARRLAAEHAIDLTRLAGSGPDGRIVESDVRRAIAGAAAVEPPAAAAPAAAPAADALAYSGRRRLIGERMLQSLQTMAQLTFVSEVVADDALKMLHGLNRAWRRDGVVVTLTALLVRACALALREHPVFNARLEGDRIVIPAEVNVGIAVDHEAGLIVPVVKGPDRASLKEVAGAVRTLTERARANALTFDEVSDATFTITSLESTRVDAFTPVINPPQAAILGIGRVREVAAFEGAAVVRRQVITLSLTFDHRVSDGAPAARFLDAIAEFVERPYLLM
jgi:pyruvate dehydrogenase E2 component (dihydrolipoamide acetyltransferase)